MWRQHQKEDVVLGALDQALQKNTDISLPVRRAGVGTIARFCVMSQPDIYKVLCDLNKKGIVLYFHGRWSISDWGYLRVACMVAERYEKMDREEPLTKEYEKLQGVELQYFISDKEHEILENMLSEVG